MENEKIIDKSLNYKKHQRDYPLLGTTVFLEGLFNKNKDFFHSCPHPIFLIIKEGIFYHFMSEDDGVNRCKNWLKNNEFKELKEVEEEYDKKLEEFNEFYDKDPGDFKDAIKKLHNYIVDFTNIVFIGFEMPEICGEEISKELYDLCFEIRKKYEDVHKRCFSKEGEILEKLSEKYNIEKGVLSYLTFSEFDEFLEIKKIPENIEKRKDFFIYKYSERGEKTYSDPDLWKQFEEEQKSDELKGSTSFPGFVKGRVRIIKKIEEASDLKEKEILVASMTDPRYVPAMKKAAAIVTDEGGITCHAAIVSRELKIPCITGTKTATQILKNGMLVEVDADNGIVRILENE